MKTAKKSAKKARPIMTTQTANDKDKEKTTGYNASSTAEQRGAGSGEHANATRGRRHDQSPAEYEKGDIAKGRIDPEEMTLGQVATIKATRDRRAYLIDQAEKNEAANDELNAIQTEQNKKVQLAQNLIQDPDRMREESMETAINALKAQDPDVVKENIAARQKARDKDAKTGARAVDQTTEDFKAGQASG
jgi:hypothetical protein